ncbi:metal-dependent hydrolase [Candidatus Nanopelagicaceae bacterium]
MTTVDLKEAAAAYEAATQYFLNLARAVTPDLMDVHAENEWSARQCIHHMADSEAQSYARLRRLVAEPEGSIIQGYDEEAWANEPKLAYADSDVANSIAVYAAVRAASLDVVKRLEESDLEKFGEHTESGKYSIARWLETYTKHPYDHGDQMVRATKGQA